MCHTQIKIQRPGCSLPAVCGLINLVDLSLLSLRTNPTPLGLAGSIVHSRPCHFLPALYQVRHVPQVPKSCCCLSDKPLPRLLHPTSAQMLGPGISPQAACLSLPTSNSQQACQFTVEFLPTFVPEAPRVGKLCRQGGGTQSVPHESLVCNNCSVNINQINHQVS